MWSFQIKFRHVVFNVKKYNVSATLLSNRSVVLPTHWVQYRQLQCFFFFFFTREFKELILHYSKLLILVQKGKNQVIQASSDYQPVCFKLLSHFSLDHNGEDSHGNLDLNLTLATRALRMWAMYYQIFIILRSESQKVLGSFSYVFVTA